MIIGGKWEIVVVIVEEIGIDMVIVGVFLDGKVVVLDQLMVDGEKIVFVGDGINDVLVFVYVDVGIVIGIGIDVVIEFVDVVLMLGDLCGVVNVYEVLKCMMCNIQENFFWVFVYNMVLILVVVGVFYLVFGVFLLLVLVVGVMVLFLVFVLMNVLWFKGIWFVIDELMGQLVLV